MDHKQATIKAFNKDYGPFWTEAQDHVGAAYDHLYSVVGGILTNTPPKKAAHSLAAGILAAHFRQVCTAK